MPHLTDWFMRARWGVNITFMASGGEKSWGVGQSVDEWNRRVDAFDVDGLAAQLGALNVPYCFLTLGQNSGHFCSPNAVYDDLAGIRPSKCSRRDLVMDLALALARHQIRLLVYLPSGAPAADPVARERLEWDWGYQSPWPNGYCDNLRTGKRLERFQIHWQNVIGEWSTRWGDRVWGWWLDGCYFSDEMYRNPQPPNFESLAGALKSGNPQALVAFNPGQIAPLVATSEWEDITAGEIDATFPLCPGRWVERNKHAVQWHVYSWIGPHWGGGQGEPRLPEEFVIGYTRQAAQHEGVVTWDVPHDQSGLIHAPYQRILENLGKAVRPEKSFSPR